MIFSQGIVNKFLWNVTVPCEKILWKWTLWFYVWILNTITGINVSCMFTDNQMVWSDLKLSNLMLGVWHLCWNDWHKNVFNLPVSTDQLLRDTYSQCKEVDVILESRFLPIHYINSHLYKKGLGETTPKNWISNSQDPADVHFGSWRSNSHLDFGSWHANFGSFS